MTIFLFTLTVLVLMICCMVLQLYKMVLNPQRTKLIKNKDGLKKGTKYPFELLRTIDGKVIETEKNKDGFVLIMISYGCEACKRVYPFLEELRKEYKNIQFHLLMLANKEQAQENIDLFNLENFSVSLIKNEQLHSLGITGFPFSYLLSKEGKVLEKGLVNHKKDFDLLISFLPFKRAS
ncbi:MAG: hypothetical protein Q8934_10395 [Bacillota bacterium]|nr:hypothetical protein [Bacillota bacterium]